VLFRLILDGNAICLKLRHGKGRVVARRVVRRSVDRSFVDISFHEMPRDDVAHSLRDASKARRFFRKAIHPIELRLRAYSGAYLA